MRTSLGEWWCVLVVWVSVVWVLVLGDVVSRASNPIQMTKVYGCGYDRIVQAQICLMCDSTACGVYRIAFRSSPVGVRTDIPTTVRSFTVRSTRRLVYVYYQNNSLYQYNMDNWWAAPLDTGFSFSSGTVTAGTCTFTGSAPTALTVGDDDFAYGVVGTCSSTLVFVKYNVPLGGSTLGGTPSYVEVSITESAGTVQSIAPFYDSALTQQLYTIVTGGASCPLLYLKIAPLTRTSTTLLCRATTTCPVGSASITSYSSTYDALHDRVITALGSCNVVASVPSSGSTLKVLAGTGASGYTDGYAQFEAVVGAAQAPSVDGRQVFFFSQSEASGYIVGRVLGATSTQSKTTSATTTISQSQDFTSSGSSSSEKSVTRSQTHSATVSIWSPTRSSSEMMTISASTSPTPSKERSSTWSLSESSDSTLSSSPTVSTTKLSSTADASMERSSSLSRSPTASRSQSPSSSATPSRTGSDDSHSRSKSSTSESRSASAEGSATVTNTITGTESSDRTVSNTPSPGTQSITRRSHSPSRTASPSCPPTPSPTGTATNDPSPSSTPSHSVESETLLRSATATVTESQSRTHSPSSYSLSQSGSDSAPFRTLTPTLTWSAAKSTSSTGSPSASATTTVSTSHLMSTVRGAASWSLSKTGSAATDVATASKTSETTSESSSVCSHTEPFTATVTRWTATATFFVEDRTDTRPFYIVVGIAAAVAGVAVLGGIAFGLFKLLSSPAVVVSDASAAGAAVAVVSNESAAAVPVTTAPAAVSSSPISSAPLPPKAPIVGVARPIATRLVLGDHYAAPTVRQESSTHRAVVFDSDEDPWWASSAAPPPVGVPPTFYAHRDAIVHIEDEEPFFTEYRDANPIVPSPDAFGPNEPLWYDEHSGHVVELSPEGQTG